MRVIVCLPEDDASPWMELFRAALPGATVERRDPGAAAIPGAPCADYVVAAWPCATVFDEHPRPRAAFTVSAGVAHVLRQPNLPPDVPVIRVEDAGMAPQMVRYATSVALRVLLRADAYAAQQRRAVWEQHPARDPASLAVGVLGLGVIGAAIARALVAQGFAVRGHARTDRHVEGVRCHAGAEGLAAFLDGLALLVCVLPHTPETVGILDRAALSRLAEGAHLLNLGRGSALVEEDLLALLDSGKLAGATLDVFGREPLPADHPFWRRPEITITPHVSGLTVPSATVDQIAGKIRRLEHGLAVSGVVDRARGY